MAGPTALLDPERLRAEWGSRAFELVFPESPNHLPGGFWLFGNNLFLGAEAHEVIDSRLRAAVTRAEIDGLHFGNCKVVSFGYQELTAISASTCYAQVTCALTDSHGIEYEFDGLGHASVWPGDGNRKFGGDFFSANSPSGPRDMPRFAQIRATRPALSGRNQMVFRLLFNVHLSDVEELQIGGTGEEENRREKLLKSPLAKLLSLDDFETIVSEVVGPLGPVTNDDVRILVKHGVIDPEKKTLDDFIGVWSNAIKPATDNKARTWLSNKLGLKSEEIKNDVSFLAYLHAAEGE